MISGSSQPFLVFLFAGDSSFPNMKPPAEPSMQAACVFLLRCAQKLTHIKRMDYATRDWSLRSGICLHLAASHEVLAPERGLRSIEYNIDMSIPRRE